LYGSSWSRGRRYVTHSQTTCRLYSPTWYTHYKQEKRKKLNCWISLNNHQFKQRTQIKSKLRQYFDVFFDSLTADTVTVYYINGHISFFLHFLYFLQSIVSFNPSFPSIINFVQYFLPFNISLPSVLHFFLSFI